MNKTIYAIVCNQTPELRSIKFFYSLAGAQLELKMLANSRKYNPGVRHFTETKNNMFSFVLGWESVEVVFRIVEVEIGE